VSPLLNGVAGHCRARLTASKGGRDFACVRFVCQQDNSLANFDDFWR